MPKNRLGFDPEGAQKESPPQEDFSIEGTPWALVGREYRKFHDRTRFFIRWAVLVFGFLFATLHLIRQIVNISPQA